MSDQDSLLVGIMTDGRRAIVTPQGRLSTLTAPLLKGALADLPEDVADIDMELSSLEYISSMGLGCSWWQARHACPRAGRCGCSTQAKSCTMSST